MGNISFDPRRRVVGGGFNRNNIHSGIAEGVNAVANTMQRVTNNMMSEQQREKSLVTQTRMIGVKDNVRRQSLQFIEDKMKDEKFLSLDKEDQNSQFAEFLRPHIDNGISSLEIGDQLEEELERKKLGSLVSAGNEALHKSLKLKRYNDAGLAWDREVKELSGQVFDGTVSLEEGLKGLGQFGGEFEDGLGSDKARALIARDAPKMIGAEVQGLINRGKYSEAEALLNDKGAVKIGTLIGVSDRAKWLGLVDRTREKHVRALEKEHKKELKAQEAAAFTNFFYNGGAHADPKDPVAVKHISATYAAEAQNWEPEEFIQKSADVALRTGIVPKQLRSFLRTSAHGSTQKQYQAAQIFNAIEKNAPHLIEQNSIDKTTQARYRLINSMLENGQEPESTIKRANDLVDPENPQLHEARKEAFKDKDFGKLNFEDVTDFYDTPFEWEPSVLPEQIPSLEAEVNGVFEREYLLTGDADHAREFALKSTKKTWGVTNVDGTKRLIKYPPEHFYGLGGGETDWITKQLHADFKGVVPEGATPILVSTAKTARTAATGEPEYSVIWKEKDGTLGGLSKTQSWKPDAQARKDELIAQAGLERSQRNSSDKLISVKIKGRDKPVFMIHNSESFELKDPVTGEPLNLGLDQKVAESIGDKYYAAWTAGSALVDTPEALKDEIHKGLDNLFEVQWTSDGSSLEKFMKGGLIGMLSNNRD